MSCIYRYYSVEIRIALYVFVYRSGLYLSSNENECLDVDMAFLTLRKDICENRQQMFHASCN